MLLDRETWEQLKEEVKMAQNIDDIKQIHRTIIFELLHLKIKYIHMKR
jgi:hypothetical protein